MPGPSWMRGCGVLALVLMLAAMGCERDRDVLVTFGQARDVEPDAGHGAVRVSSRAPLPRRQPLAEAPRTPRATSPGRLPLARGLGSGDAHPHSAESGLSRPGAGRAPCTSQCALQSPLATGGADTPRAD